MAHRPFGGVPPLPSKARSRPPGQILNPAVWEVAKRQSRRIDFTLLSHVAAQIRVPLWISPDEARQMKPGDHLVRRPYRKRLRAALEEESWEQDARAYQEQRKRNPGKKTSLLTSEELEGLLLHVGARKPWHGTCQPADLVPFFNHWIEDSLTSGAFRMTAARGLAMGVDGTFLREMADWTPAEIASDKKHTWWFLVPDFLDAYLLVVGHGNMAEDGPAVRFIRLALYRCGYGAHTEASIRKQIQRQRQKQKRRQKSVSGPI